MLGEFRLTLPPETFSLDDERRSDHVRWRREALAEAREVEILRDWHLTLPPETYSLD